ncbi:radical SAM family heme chaperone HemW [Denitrobacterium detoxificans]|jgi:oxygen-independent coproporphyrinogen-3 oxidase|uniref:radical SAM family heme chaperone HemW n=1 Tax=Denitrobacterium detoxificans TaxID=79604 RepID=UPI0026EB37B5|nr:radical SAM family heme chaperone HemW [Denitrobacterium detoxificans]MBE6466079.1 radical SAM family heme chaperone HemW [Denitrobacterium detoxificans]
MYDPYKALYIHAPFCKQRCRYCDFATQAVDPSSPLIREYVDHVILEIRRAGKQGLLSQVETVYLGGGTPSYIGLGAITEIMYILGLSMHLTDQVECTMEANPDSLTERMVNDLWALGVNRLSIGVQSFDDSVLRTLGRVHDAQAARRAVEIAHGRFRNVSVDLMCGIPGQSAESFRQSLHTAIDLGVTHVSVYPLTIEPGTPFDELVSRGAMPEPDDDVEAEHMRIAAQDLSQAGFERYEVANYAKPGFQSRHNTAYWTGKPYLGIGPSAATMTQNAERRMRKQDDVITDDLDARQMRVEDVMLGMRMSRGVSERTLSRACELAPELRAVMESLVERGLVRHCDGRWQPTERGWLCGNELYGAIFDVAP